MPDLNHSEIVAIRKVRDLDFDLIPQATTMGSAGLDLKAAITGDIILEPFQRQGIPTGIAIALPDYCEGQIRPRSGLALKFGLTVLNTPGTIDADYRGEIVVILINLGDQDFTVKPGMRIAQMVIKRFFPIRWTIQENLPESERNDGGFGHTGL